MASTSEVVPSTPPRGTPSRRGKSRSQEAERLLAIDPHSPIDLRANAVRNLDEFHEAFGVAEGDALFTEPDRRVRIW